MTDRELSEHEKIDIRLEELAEAVERAPDPLLGTLLDGKIEILELVGSGGMGALYKGRHLILDRVVAVKVLKSASLTDAQAIRRFQQEAKATFGLSHQNIVATHDVGVSPDGVPYLVMDFIDAAPLSELIKGKLLGVNQSIDIILQICNGLKAAHMQGIVHRDIKPSNILVMQGKDIVQAKIVDFGIAKLLTGGGATLTATTDIIGSPPYMSPEQCAGAKIDQRSDIYSLGCVMFELFTGSTPFASETPLGMIHKHMSQNPPRLGQACDRSFPKELEDIVDRCLSKRIDARYQTIEELVNDLQLLKSGKQVRVRKPIPTKAKWVAAAVGMIIAACMIISMIRPAQPENPGDPRDCYAFALNALNSHQYALAEKWSKRAAELSPRYGEAWWCLGQVYHFENKSADSARAYEEAVKLTPSWWQCWANLSLAYQEQGKFEQGEAAARQALKIHGEDAEILLILGTALEGENKLPEAEKVLRRCLAIDATHHDAQKFLNKVMQRSGH